jgi:hypothetical protein
MKERLYLTLVLLFSGAMLAYGTQTLSISSDEAEIFYDGNTIAHYLATYSTAWFGQNDFTLRLPFILFHLASIVLLYKIGKLFLKQRLDRVLSIAIYACLPGVNSVALLVNNSSVVIFITLLFVYLYLIEQKAASHMVLIASLFIDNSFAIFYIALFIYGVMNRKIDILVLTLVLFSTSMYLYGFDTGGKPKGYFVDTFGVYAAIFSPFLFLYFIYSMYRILIKEEKNLLWYISFFSLVVSLLLSLRQKLYLEDFAPFVVLAIPLMIKVFFNSFRVRLPQFRKWHTFIFGMVVSTLIVNTSISYLHQPLYLLMNEPSKHFAIKYHVAKELAEELKGRGIYRISMKDEKMAIRLKFYGIDRGTDYKLLPKKEVDGGYEQIDIAYFGVIAKTFYIYKVG